MALLSEEMDSDLLRLWGLVAELSEQLNANRAMTAALQSQASQAKVCLLCLVLRVQGAECSAIQSGTSHPLRHWVCITTL